MRRGRRIWLSLLACGVVAVVLTLAWPREGEPEYGGKRLSAWGELYEMALGNEVTPQDSFKERAAIEAVSHMRDKVVPCALKLIRYEKPEWKNEVMRVMELRMDVRRWCPAWVWGPFYGDRADRGVFYFQMLGSNGRGAIPELEIMATDPRRGKSAERAVEALGEIGTEALPALMRVAMNTQARTRLMAVLRIARFGSNAAPAVPALVDCLRDPEGRVVGNAAAVLGELAVQPDVCVPAISSQLHHSDPYARSLAVLSLAAFGKEARSAVPALLNALNDPDFWVREEATNALQKIAPEVLRKENEEPRQKN